MRPRGEIIRQDARVLGAIRANPYRDRAEGDDPGPDRASERHTFAPPEGPRGRSSQMLGAMRHAMRRVCVDMPWLAGSGHNVPQSVTASIPTMYCVPIDRRCGIEDHL
jgi:hypothetical protein